MRQLAMLLSMGLCLTGSIGRADVKLPSIFASHMVLQRNQPVRVWGWAEPGEEVRVILEQQEHSTVADRKGNWQVEFKPLAAGGPLTLDVKGKKNSLTYKDVLVGEVWLCSGQSNMAMTVSRSLNYDAEKSQAEQPTIRMFRVGSRYASTPQADTAGSWIVCSPETVGGFSATAYFFAQQLQKDLTVPVGLINASVGGTPIESWIPADAQRTTSALEPFFEALKAEAEKFDVDAARVGHERAVEKWKAAAKAAKEAGKPAPRAPRDPVASFEKKQNVGGLFNGMVAPFITYTFRGALWYQGEANSSSGKASMYQHQLPLLVKSWRQLNGNEDFPFAWVQLPNYVGSGRNWPLVREAMLDSLYVPNTGMAITIDVGETRDIHPRNKQAVGQRLATWALASVYNQSGPAMGPLPGESKADGKSILMTFTHAEDGLETGDWKPDLRFAAIAGEDQQWHAVESIEIDGNQVRFSSSKVASPVALRYLWSNDPPQGFLTGEAGIPASPFRTDDWTAAEPFAK